MTKEKEIIISDPGDEQESITVPQLKAELTYVTIVLILISLMLLGGAMYHPRAKYKSNIEKNSAIVQKNAPLLYIEK